MQVEEVGYGGEAIGMSPRSTTDGRNKNQVRSQALLIRCSSEMFTSEMFTVDLKLIFPFEPYQAGEHVNQTDCIIAHLCTPLSHISVLQS